MGTGFGERGHSAGDFRPAGQTDPSSAGWYAVTFATHPKTTHDMSR
ncbi:hypothetical protein [Methanoculleus sp. 10]|nr:hypothetical protein [Methanoculleus sp. 10]